VRRRRPRRKGAAPGQLSRAHDSAAERSLSRGGLTDSQPALDTRIQYRCPLCGRSDANATYKLDRDGDPRWFVGCWGGSCASGGDYLQSLGEALEVGADAELDELIGALLASDLVRVARRRREADDLPTPRKLKWWWEALEDSPGAAYLASRGIPFEVAESARVGWDGRALWFPMYRRGEIVAAKHRAPRDGAKMLALTGSGRPWPLYPEVEPGWWTVLVVAGELDALRGRAAGLPACSVTLGASKDARWRDEWTNDLHGRRVVICLDNNEQDKAREWTAHLNSVGVRARRLDLRDLGLTDEKGDLTDYLNGGGTAAEIRAAMRPRIVPRRRAA
jgi:hypothetical protein